MLRTLLLCLALSALAACAPRGMIEKVLPVPEASLSLVEEILVVTTRRPLSAPPFFGTQRGEGASYARFDVSVPPDHEIGDISWPGSARPDPAKHFLTVGHEALPTASAFDQSLRNHLRSMPPENRDVVLFVHGFNTNFPEALYRMAQIQADFEAPGQQVLFSWASGARAGAYLYDRDSALIARDALEDTLRRLDRVSQGRVTLVGFSLGGFLVVETLRQIGLSSDSALLDRLDAVVLISPDIDVQLFRANAGDIVPFPKPFVILASREDRTLELAALITGQRERLGTLESLQGLEDLGITLIDISAFDREAASSHTVGLTSPSLIRILRSVRQSEAAQRGTAERGADRVSIEQALNDLQSRIVSYGR
ncbi:MAG: alpha/beta fold hydrolase [Sulfitobacter sp.]|nr:alpha/beta fold hydrolase [Sulfitobacter sp.]